VFIEFEVICNVKDRFNPESLLFVGHKIDDFTILFGKGLLFIASWTEQYNYNCYGKYDLNINRKHVE
jgi:hypothetical protein